MKEERKKYERPSMKRNLVELEDGFCAGSVVTTGNNQVETTGHELNDIDLSSDSWNSYTDTDVNNGWELK